MILGQKQYARSPVPQAYIWIADYYDGTFLSEYDLQTKRSTNFYDIQKDKLVYFGVIGQGSQVYYNVANGVFHINMDRYSIAYECEGQEYPLTGRTFVYNDIIQYKNGSSESSVREFTGRNKSGAFKNAIECFNFGYKKTMDLHDANINFQCVCSLPMNQSAFFQIKITSNIDLPGQLIIRKNGLIIDRVVASLKANHAGVINWDLR